jgi:oligopeptide transport system substrate-binding protein
VAQIGGHFAEAGEGARAVDYLLEAGDHARSLYDDRAALEHYNRALGILRHQGDRARTARTLMKVGLTHHTARDYLRSQAAFEEGFTFFQQVAARREEALPPAPHPLRIVHYSPSFHTWDPNRAPDTFTRALLQQLFGGLVSIGPDYAVLPDIARRWDVMDQGRSYIFHLRDDVFWSDGVPVTARDFEYSWKRALHPATQATAADLLLDIRGATAFHHGQAGANHVAVRALDPVTLQVDLDEPTSYFLYLLTDVVASPVPQHIVEQYGASWADPERIVTCGPFRPKQYATTGKIVLERYDHYHGHAMGNVRQVVFEPRGDWSDNHRRYQEGELDVLALYYPPTREMLRARHILPGEYVSYPNLNIDLLLLATSQPPLDDVTVRQALALSIDKVELAAEAMGNFVVPAQGGLVPPSVPGHSVESLLGFDPDRARRLLASAGFADGRGFPHLRLRVVKSLEPIAETLARQWRNHLQIDLKVEIEEWDGYWTRLLDDPPSIAHLGWHGDFPDPDAYLSKGPLQAFGDWHDELYDWLAGEAKAAPDQTHRLEYYRQMDRMLVEEAVVIPIAYGQNHLLVKPWVTVYPTSPLTSWLWKDVVIEPHQMTSDDQILTFLDPTV